VAVAGAGALIAGTAALLILTVGLGWPWATLQQSPGVAALAESLTLRRILLWHDAMDLARDNPWTGVGPNRFSTASPIAQADSDTPFAHSLLLETAAEAGVIAALALLVVLVAVLVAVLVRADGLTRLVAVAAVCGFAAQSFIDYTYRYPAVTLGWAVLVGVLTRRDSPQMRHSL
jgi:O-antigen ligase